MWVLRLGLRKSPSINNVEIPDCASVTARSSAVVDFPSPESAEQMLITFVLISGLRLISAKRLDLTSLNISARFEKVFSSLRIKLLLSFFSRSKTPSSLTPKRSDSFLILSSLINLKNPIAKLNTKLTANPTAKLIAFFG